MIIFPKTQEENYAICGDLQVPAVFDETGSLDIEATTKKVNFFLDQQFSHKNPAKPVNNFRDGNNYEKLWVYGEVVREAQSVNTPEAVPIIELFCKYLPEFAGSVFSTPYNWIGISKGYREPYSSDAISWYEYKRPLDSLLDRFGVKLNRTTLLPWYGIKYVIDTGDFFLKVVHNDLTTETPELPVGTKFFAEIYATNGTVQEDIDCYIYTTPEKIKEFCNKFGLAYPATAESEANVDLWSVVFSRTTLEIKIVKAYDFTTTD